MKSKEEIMFDYVAKERAERTGGNSILNKCLAWGIAISYMAYTFCFMIPVLDEKQVSDKTLCGVFIMLFFILAVPLAFLIASFPFQGIGKEIEAARNFLLETGQQATRENINILMDRYYKGGWQKIEDMLYENRKTFLAENMKFISGNEKVLVIPRKSYESGKIMIEGDI